MKPLPRLPRATRVLSTLAAALLLGAGVGGCASRAKPAPTPAPAREPITPAKQPITPAIEKAPDAPKPVATTPTPAARRLEEAPRDWQLLDETADGVPGISVRRAERELLAGRQPRRTVVVAVIDGGVDTAHVDLRGNLWTNTKEIAGNGKDDDNNGYVDDVHGWNFIGGRDGRDVHHDTFELTRLYGRCTDGPRAGADSLAALGIKCDEVKQEFEAKRTELQQQSQTVQQISAMLEQALPILRQATGTESLTVARVRALRPTTPAVQQAQGLFLNLAAQGATPADVEEARTALASQVEFGLNPRYDPRPIVGDNYGNPAERRYGNRDVTGPDAKHGSHVSGIIGATRGNDGVDGIATAVRIMAIRAVPDGDERDKDVANAIRYAVDNGAQIINMSFGKAYSPQKGAVDEAVRYADAHGVLMVHAAGNDGEDNDTDRNYPTPAFLGGGRAQNWIEVGASSWKTGDSLVASFSNYGHTMVDVFAPGVDILSTVPGSNYERASGTSMAAPVVTGLAALIMSYYPTLAAPDVKRIILTSATSHAQQMVIRPGSQDRVPFGTLSSTGGIVNAYNALRMAEQMSTVKP